MILAYLQLNGHREGGAGSFFIDSRVLYFCSLIAIAISLHTVKGWGADFKTRGFAVIYELSLVAKANLGESLKQVVHETVKNFEGEVLVEDDWGVLTLAQPSKKGVKQGHFLYFIFKANNQCNSELIRRFRINENHLRHLIVALGKDGEGEALVQAYKTPFSKTYYGSVTDKEGAGEDERNPRKFARRRICYFTTNGIRADWKEPATYTWLVNEFGKISPGRVSGISTKHQRFVTTAIKRARQIGLMSCVSAQIAEKS